MLWVVLVTLIAVVADFKWDLPYLRFALVAGAVVWMISTLSIKSEIYAMDYFDIPSALVDTTSATSPRTLPAYTALIRSMDRGVIPLAVLAVYAFAPIARQLRGRFRARNSPSTGKA